MLESCKVHGNNHKSCKFLLELQILSFLEKHCALLPLKLQENIIFSFWEKPKFVCQSFFQVKIMPHKKKRRLFPTISGAIFLRTLTYFSTTKVLSGPITMSQGRVLSQGFRFRKIHNFYCSIKDTLKWAFLFVLFFFWVQGLEDRKTNQNSRAPASICAKVWAIYLSLPWPHYYNGNVEKRANSILLLLSKV